MKKYFNMIEVTLAIAIVALGMVGILALFPVGFQSTRDAMGENYINNASQIFLSYIKLAAKRDISAGYAQSQAYIDSQWKSIIIDSIPTSKPDSGGAGEPTANFTPTGTLASIRECTATPGLYRVYQGSAGVNDFTATVRIWKTPAVSPVKISGVWTFYSTIDYSKSCGINIEFSWPVEKPYAQRTKRCFYCELFKPIL